MLQNASSKQNKTTTKKRKRSHPAGIEPETFNVSVQRIIHCATQPLLRLYVKLIVFNTIVPAHEINYSR